ncbi:FAD-dependent oxidoreductase [Rhizobium favelukesii]
MRSLLPAGRRSPRSAELTAMHCQARPARRQLAKPFDNRLFFAGEATSATDFSTAHGAYQSGVRAAGQAIIALKPAHSKVYAEEARPFGTDDPDEQHKSGRY